MRFFKSVELTYFSLLFCLFFLGGGYLKDIIFFLFYVFVYFYLCGGLLSNILANKPSNISSFIFHSYGLAYQITFYFLLSVVGCQKFIIFSPLPLILAHILKNGYLPLKLENEIYKKETIWVCLITSYIVVFSNPYLLTPYLDTHFIVQTLTTHSVLDYKYPFNNPLFDNIPLMYSYFYHLLLAGAYHFTKIEPLQLVSLYGIVYIFSLTAFLLLMVSRFFISYYLLRILFIFLVLDTCACATLDTHLFYNYLGKTSIFVPAVLSGILFFLTAFYAYLRFSNKYFFSYKSFCMFLLVFFALCGSRASGAIVFMGGIFLCFLNSLLKQNVNTSKKFLFLGIICTSIFLVVFYLVYGSFWKDYQFNFTTFVSWPSINNYEWLPKSLPMRIFNFLDNGNAKSVLISIFLIFFSAGFACIGLFYQLFLFFKSKKTDDKNIFLLGVMITSAFFWFFTDAPGSAQYTFYNYLILCSTLLGCVGVEKVYFIKNKHIKLILLILISFFIGIKFIDTTRLFVKEGLKKVKDIPVRVNFPNINTSNFIRENINELEDNAVILDLAKKSLPDNSIIQKYIIYKQRPDLKLWAYHKWMIHPVNFIKNEADKNKAKKFLLDLESCVITKESIDSFKSFLKTEYFYILTDKSYITSFKKIKCDTEICLYRI